MLVLFAWDGSSHSINPALTADHGRVRRAVERTTCCALEVCKGLQREHGKLRSYNSSYIGFDKK